MLAGAVVALHLTPALSLYGLAEGGAAYGSLSTGTSAPDGVVRAGTGFEMNLAPDFFARMDAAWTYKFALYGAFGTTLDMGWRLPAPASPAPMPVRPSLLELSTVDIKNVFPILRSYYDEHPLGTITIANTSKVAAHDVKVSFIIKQYMDAPKECAQISAIEPGQSAKVNLFGLFNDNILAVTEATKASAEVSVEYEGDGALTKSSTVTVYDRTALTWADGRTAAAFVSSKDPWVLDLCGNIIASVKGSRNGELAPTMQTAIALHEGLRAFGLGDGRLHTTPRDTHRPCGEPGVRREYARRQYEP